MTTRNNSWKNYRNSEELIYNIRKRHMQKKFRRRRLCVAFAICVAAFLFVSTVVFANSDHGPMEFSPVAVEAGDSLWSLAQEYYPNMNVRNAISQIKKVNQLTDSTIYEGDVLLLPAIHD